MWQHLGPGGCSDFLGLFVLYRHTPIALSPPFDQVEESKSWGRASLLHLSLAGTICCVSSRQRSGGKIFREFTQGDDGAFFIREVLQVSFKHRGSR